MTFRKTSTKETIGHDVTSRCLNTIPFVQKITDREGSSVMTWAMEVFLRPVIDSCQSGGELFVGRYRSTAVDRLKQHTQVLTSETYTCQKYHSCCTSTKHCTHKNVKTCSCNFANVIRSF